MVTRVTESKAPVPEGRRYFLKVLNRIEFEVTPGEYDQVAWRMLGTSDRPASDLKLTFHLGIIDGWYVDPKREVEVIDSGNRT